MMRKSAYLKQVTYNGWIRPKDLPRKTFQHSTLMFSKDKWYTDDAKAIIKVVFVSK